MSVKGNSGMSGEPKLGIKKRSFWKREQHIRKWEETVRDSDIEHGQVFDEDGNTIGDEAEGDHGSVMFDWALAKWKYTSHNHPDIVLSDGTRLEGGVFSKEDIANFVNNERFGHRAVDSKMVYTVEVADKKSLSFGMSADEMIKYFQAHGKMPDEVIKASEVRAKLREFAKSYAKADAKFKKQARLQTDKEIFTGKLKYSSANDTKRFVELWFNANRIWLKNHASEYGVIYSEHNRRRVK